METSERKEVWVNGEAYERYVGRWSRLVGQEFVGWLDVPPGKRWLDVGCGTGELTRTILSTAQPDSVVGLEPSEGFIAYAREQTADSRARFDSGSATALPYEDASFDGVVAGLVLNFVPQPERALAEMARVVRRGGIVGVYVWDYAEKMELIRYFFDAAVALDPAARELDEGPRFPICQPGPLGESLQAAGLRDVEVRAIDVPTVFADFDDYWSPFEGGQGPAPAYAMSLSEEKRAALRDTIRSRLPFQPDGSIRLIARAWAARGVH